MSLNTTNTTVTLTLNGQQALQTLNQLRANALNLETAIAKAAASGNKVDLKRLRKELQNTRKQIREIESATMQVDSVMLRLNKATPKELNKSLQTLNRQLQYLERGSEVWNSHVARIKAVKAELAKINAELRTQEGFWTRFNRTLNDWQTSLMGAIAAVTGFVMAGRSAVKAYAGMDEQLANTSKYTGMSRESVEELNDAFKHMDTRTSREQLNELAQEAGRLGKNTLEDVKGYVEAADIINVALVDLGAGATQTIAKLSNIFGVEKVMGTKDAMLSVGSAVNVLSQNCTASKTYLVEFAQRMAGIGAQANLSIPEILAFGATLDANGQKTEMSSSALGKLIMMLNQKPEELAKAVGLNTKELKELLKSDTAGAVIRFLEQIQKMGSKEGLTVLAPLFKDMGMDGVRMSQVLATLAEHLDMVKWEVGEANKAFSEATSATNEYVIFNNTVQAGLDKAKKRVSELAIELGKELQPVMKHVISSTSMLMKVMLECISFTKEHWTEIRTATVMLTAYTVGVKAHAIATKLAAVNAVAWNAIIRMAMGVANGYTTAMVLSREALTGCTLANSRLHRHMIAQNTITKLTTASVLLMKVAYYACTLQFRAMATSLKSLYAVMSANPYGIVLAALAALGVALYNQVQKKRERLRLMEEERLKEKELMKDYDQAKVKIAQLSKILNDNNRSMVEREAALAELKKMVPDYHASLSQEGKLINDNKKALDDYLVRLKESILLKASREKLEELYKEQADLQETVEQQRSEYWKHRQDNALLGKQVHPLVRKMSRLFGTDDEDNVRTDLEKTQERLREVNGMIARLEEKVKPEAFVEAPKGGEGDNDDPIVPPTTDVDKDKFAKEKEWKEKEEALNRIAYARGEKDYEEYRRRMDEIAVEYNAKLLERTDLTEKERLSFQADYHEAVKKQTEEADKERLAREDKAYNEGMAVLKQRYIDGESSLKEYEDATALLELEHLRMRTRLTAEGSRERAEAEKAYQDRLLSDRKNRQKELEEAEKKHQDTLKKIKEKAFGLNEAERKAAYQTDLADLTEVYNRELLAAEGNAKEKLRIEKAFQEARLALMKRYNIEGAGETRNAMAKAVGESLEWLKSDGGQAMTGAVDTLVSGMSSIFSQLSSLIQAELEIQTAAIEKRYEKEISLAEGNAYREAQLEKQKEEEIAAVKKEANRKMFAMQVIQAVAQTAQGAIAAYSSAAAIPSIGWIMAPIAAAMALAAGAIQIASIKKQQQASESQGYARGGYTPKGRKDEEVGIVHAGEWVASQELLANPVASQMIATLDQAQRTNTIGALKEEDVSRSITAPIRMTEVARSMPSELSHRMTPVVQQSDSVLESYADTMRRLKDRLNEPFVTINTVDGEHGIRQAQSEYDRLLMNKTPKSRR